MKYDSKTGRYFLEVRYENEPDYTYTYEVIDDKILTIAYDQKNSEVTTDLKHILKWKILKNGEKEHKGKLLSLSVLA